MSYYSLKAIRESLSWLATNHGITGPANAKFVDRNCDTWFFAFDVWENMFHDIAGGDELLARIYELSQGNAYNAITVGVGMADQLVAHMSREKSLPEPFTDWTDNAGALLTVLRFLKRLSLVGADWLTREAQKKFWSCMDVQVARYHRLTDDADGLHPSVLDRYTNPWFYTSMLPVLRKEVEYLVPNDLKLSTSEFGFSNGAVQDACTHPFCKWVAANYRGSDDGKLGRVLTPDPVIGRPSTVDWTLTYWGPEHERDFIRREKKAPNQDVWHLYANRTEYYCVKPITVPKQLTSVRVICPEDAYHARIQLGYAESLMRYWKREHITTDKYGDLDAPIQSYCQDNSRLACRMAYSQGLATTDCTACSDTVRRDFLRLLNNRTIDTFMGVMPTHIKWDKVTRRMEMFGTMGSPLTFPMEEVVLYALAKWAIGYSKLWLEDDSLPETVLLVGDDCILPQYAAETFLDALTACGMIPNASKTYTKGYYFESCGEESWRGQSVAGIYFPRGFDLQEIDLTKWNAFDEAYESPLGSLVTLANRLLDDGWCGANQVVVRKLSAYGDVILDPTNTPGTLHGTGTPYIIQDIRDDTIRVSSVADAHMPWERYVVTTVSAYDAPDEGKRGCWCHTLDSKVRDTLLRKWCISKFCAQGPLYNNELDRLLHISMEDDAGARFGTRKHHKLSKRLV